MREEEGRGRGMQMRPALEKVLGGTKAFIVRSLLPIVATNPPYAGANGQCGL